MTKSRAQRLAQWRERLNASGLPVFSRTVREIRNVSSSRASSAQDLSDVIGHDASMAARVIQIANSPLFNLQNRDIDTINAAVVMVGFDAVRDLVISVSVIEEMLKGHQHTRVGQHMARAFHAAAQARSFARQGGEKAEEVFVGALLKYVGEMAFWSRAEREAIAIEAELQQGVDERAAQKKVLGFELSELSQVLAEDWNLGELLTHVLDGRHEVDRQVQHVELAHELAEVLEQHAWGSKEANAVLKKLSRHLDMKIADVEAMASANLDAAVAIAERFGVQKPGAALAAPVEPPQAEIPPDSQSALQQPPGFDARKLFDVMREIADQLEQGATRHELMQLVVDALRQALGMQCAYFALFSPDRTSLQIKYASIDADADKLSGRSVGAAENELFVRAASEGRMILFRGTELGAGHAEWHFGGDGAVAVVKLAGRPVGVLYGETAPGAPLSEDQAAGFRQLNQQIALILAQAG